MSNPEAMQQLTDRFVNDAGFREEMREDPEGTAECAGYEFGHVYGLGHPRGKHPSLTMNWAASTCDASLRTLGRGDVLALGRIYR